MPRTPKSLCEQFDLDEHGIFIIEDGIRSSVPWKRMRSDEHRALTDEQIASLAGEFDLKAAELDALSFQLAITLNPGLMPNLVSVRRSIAAARAGAEIEAAYRDVWAAEDKLDRAIERLGKLSLNAAGGLEDGKRFRRAKRLLEQSSKNLRAAGRLLADLSDAPEVALLIAPTDKRLLHDRLRTRILTDLFYFWEKADRRLTYTTDPITSERRGRLIEFVNAVVLCISDPPGRLGGETIRAEIKAFRKRKAERASVLIDPAQSDRST